MSATGNEVEKAMEKDFNAMLNDLATRCYMMGYEAAKKEIIHCKDCECMKPFEVMKEGHSYCAKIGCIVEENNYCCWAAGRKG